MLRKYFIKLIAAQIRAAKTMEEIVVKGSKMFAGFTTTCEGYCCEDCSNNDANTPGSFCGGNNCGWCHGAVTVWVDGVPYGQGGCDYNDAIQEEVETVEEYKNLPPEEGFEEVAEE